ncbi:beta-propeller domain-containing protein [Faecalicatena contorta]|uniref:Beta propeller domain-containing protein n=1 Tax=Faecalicatena contorta TaxID=39482 RepID=A0A315ZV90_9FIRM|nr:beta-propeller domain-containing protein [Faecalicatena contorta]PWJ49123.1 beta propeller domain-containing protein [Faecalicatena contorta]SUQ14828.1 Beta propeller domain-containing protein [Faecalicatena contorta]
MTLDGNDLKKNPEEEMIEEQTAEGQEIEENKLEEQLRQMTEDVEIPESLKPENIEKLLEEKGKLKRFRWKTVYTVGAAAACCALVIGIAAFGGLFQKNEDTAGSRPGMASADNASDAGEESSAPVSSGDRVIASAKSYDEVYQYIEAERKSQEQYNSETYVTESSRDEGAGTPGTGNTERAAQESKADSSATNDVSGNGSYSDTNIREEGVGEGDIVKTDGKNLYILNGQRIQIVSIEKQEMKQMATIRLEDDQYISEVYVKDEKLILVYTKTEYEDGKEGYGGTYKQYTVAETYDVSDTSKPKSIGKITQSGSFYTMRVSGDDVYILSNFYADTAAGRTDIGAYIPQVQGKEIDSKNILLPQYVRGNQYTVISTFSLKDPGEKKDNKAVFGNAGLVYVSKNNIYVCEAYYNSAESDVTQTCIRKVAYKDGKLEAVGQTRINGTLNDSFSIDEYKGNLRLVTTVSSTGNGSGFPIVLFNEIAPAENSTKKDTNSLYILDEKLNETGKIEGLAEDERVYSARFMGDTGYFVTFKQVDPLFSVDLSNPKKPKIIGELKIPGFSDYLHPYGEGLLLGVGMDVDKTGTMTQGVKLSMFDISNPKDVKEVQKYILEDSYSTDISYNYKAALVSTDRNLIGFSAYGQGQSYYLFSYDKENGFKNIFERELGGYSEARGIYSGNTFYIVAGNTVESYNMDTFDKIDDIVL